MTAGGSQQLRLYRRARRDGATMATACVISGISMGEARLHEAADAKDPPPPEAFELLNPAPVEAQPKENDDMARPRKNDAPISGEVPKPDFDHAHRVYQNDIVPANREQKRAMKEASDAWKVVKKEARVHVAGFRAAMKVAEMEEAEQQVWLRSFNAGLQLRHVTLEADLVDQAEGKQPENVVPIGSAQRPQLATIPHPDDDSDLADAGEAVADEREQGEAPAEAAE